MARKTGRGLNNFKKNIMAINMATLKDLWKNHVSYSKEHNKPFKRLEPVTSCDIDSKQLAKIAKLQALNYF